MMVSEKSFYRSAATTGTSLTNEEKEDICFSNGLDDQFKLNVETKEGIAW